MDKEKIALEFISVYKSYKEKKLLKRKSGRVVGGDKLLKYNVRKNSRPGEIYPGK